MRSRNNDTLRQNYDILAYIWIKCRNYLSEVGATYSIYIKNVNKYKVHE